MEEATLENFEKLTKEGMVLVDMWAPWCGPCKMQMPILDKLNEKELGVKIVKVNVDDAPELPAKFGVRSIPTLILMQGGEVKETMIGLQQLDVLVKAIEALD